MKNSFLNPSTKQTVIVGHESSFSQLKPYFPQSPFSNQTWFVRKSIIPIKMSLSFGDFQLLAMFDTNFTVIIIVNPIEYCMEHPHLFPSFHGKISIDSIVHHFSWFNDHCTTILPEYPRVPVVFPRKNSIIQLWPIFFLLSGQREVAMPASGQTMDPPNLGVTDSGCFS